MAYLLFLTKLINCLLEGQLKTKTLTMINTIRNQRIFYWSCFLFLFLLSSLSAQGQNEICGNGMDDDGDGLIDCYDPDCCGFTGCDATFYDPCDIEPTCFEGNTPGTFSIRRARISSVPTLPGTPAVPPMYEAGIPFVGDIDSDGEIEYVVVDGTGPAHVFEDGTGGITHSATLYGGTLNGVTLTAVAQTTVRDSDPYPAIGNLDNDGEAEVVVRQLFSVPDAITGNLVNHHHLCVYNATGTLLAFFDLDASADFTYLVSAANNNKTGTIGIYDFDGDGVAEISHGLGIFRYNPGGTGSRLELLGYPQTIEGRGINNNYYGEQVVAVDVDPITAGYGLELIAGNTVYDVNTAALPWIIGARTIATRAADGVEYPDGYTSVVDWDGDELLDVVVSSSRGDSSFIYVWDPISRAILAESDPIGPNNDISRASVTDFDNDGALEIVVTTSRNFRIFEFDAAQTSGNGIPLLINSDTEITTDRSGNTTCTAFDFNSDGTKEIVYRDETTLRIFTYDGTTLTEEDSSSCFSGTIIEYPIVADVDNDGQAEIVCACNTANTNANQAFITVFESNGFPWADARSVWNQHAYFYANINDDLSIPVNQQNHALPHDGAALVHPGHINSFLHQYTDTVFRLPNAVISDPTWDCEMNTITVEVCNEGDNILPIGMPITVYGEDPTVTSPAIIGSTTLGTSLNPDGSCVFVTIQLASNFSVSTPTVVYVMLNAEASMPTPTPTPFNLTNYTPPGTTWECDYTNNIGNVTVFPKPTIGITASVPNPVCQGSDVVLTATSSNNGISSVLWNPASVGTTNPVTVAPTATQTYFVTVTDNNGCNGTASLEVEVEACCPIATDPSYLHLTANTDLALLTQNGLNAPVFKDGALYYTLASNYYTLPSRVYIDDGIVLEIRGDGAILDLVNSDIVFGQCARLEVTNGAELRAYNTVFRPCNEATSWAGVEFRRTSRGSSFPTGNIRECTFINADVALNLGRYRNTQWVQNAANLFQSQVVSDITIQDNLFSNCKRGIRVHNFAPEQAISGNDFQIDNVDEITFHELDCSASANDNKYIGIELLSSTIDRELINEYALNIHQNTFIDATPVDSSNSEYIGIESIESIAQLEISANDFTNMFQSINFALHNSFFLRKTMIEGNEINVTRRMALNNIGSSQIVIRFVDVNGIIQPSRNIEIFNNTLSSSADAPPLIDLGNAAFMQSAINIDNASFSIVRDNIIEGFEVGIYIRQAGNINNRRMKVNDNKIKSNYYGIFLDSELNQATTNPSVNTYIQCNEIEMDLENNATSVGIAVHFNADIASATDHFISGNCIKHSHRAIEIINNTSISARMPTVLNNYLYNYIEAGVSIEGTFNSAVHANPTIGGRNFVGAAANNSFGGHNTFISNNENNAVDVSVAGPTIVDVVNNDYGTTGTAIVNNPTFVQVIQNNSTQYPSFAKCANQDASLVQDNANNLQSVPDLYFCGEDDEFINSNVLFRTNTSGSTILINNYTQSIQDLVADDNGSLLYELAVNALANLSSQVDKDVLYSTVVNTGVLTTNKAAWLSYHYERVQGNYTAAKQVVQGIQGDSEDENEAQVIAIINMDLLISSRTMKELTNNEIQTLKDIDDRRGANAVEARNMVDVAIGGHPYLFKPYPFSKALSSKDVSRMDLNTASLTIYPNPTNDLINIDFVVTEGSDQVLNIYNATGKLIKSVSTKAMVGQLTIDVADLAQGMYIATLKSENGNVQSGKFVKK